jgi:membrane protease subunit HflK
MAILVLLALTLGYLATGWVTVAPGESAVVLRLGSTMRRPWTHGPHWGLPIGFDRIVRVRTGEVRRLEVGLAGVPGADDDPAAGEFLTGDRNLLRARAVVQYRVVDPVAYVTRAERVESIVALLAESSLSRSLSRQGIDRALRDGRADVARDAVGDLSRAVKEYGIGVVILGISLTDVRPPTEVQPDFAAAQSARSDRERKLAEAKTYHATTLTAARAEADARQSRAKAASDRTAALAKASAERFVSLATEAQRARALTVRRIYLDTLRDLLPRVRRKLLLTPDEPVDITVFGDREKN